MDQDIINWALGVLSSILAWLSKTLWNSVVELKKDLHTLEVEMANSYAKKTDIDAKLTRIENLILKVDDKLDTKVDK